MKSTKHVLWVLLFATMSANAAQLYRWVDGKGNVEWRDTPPPAAAAAKKVEQRTINPGVVSAPEQPYSVQLAAKNFPVTLWATDCGDACSLARAHLARRGVPHTEKNPQSDMEAFKKVAGSTGVPFLEVGNTKLQGYLESAWDDALDFAGYPKTALVPLKPPPKPAAAPPKAAAADGVKPADGAAAPVPTSAQPAALSPAAQAPTTPVAPSPPGPITAPTIR